MKIRKSGFLLYGLLLAAVIVAGRMIFHTVPFYEMLVKTYAGWLGNATASCLGILGYSAIYEAATAKLVIAGWKEIDFLHQLALKFYVFMFVLLLPFTKKKLQTGLFLSMGILILFATAVLRNVALVIAEGQIIDLVMALSYLVRYSLLWLAIVYRVRLHPDLLQLYEKANLRFKERFQLSLSALAFLVLISGSMMSLIDRFIIQSESLLAIVMSKIILSLSETLLHLLHYQPIIDGNYIWLGNVWVFLGSPCLGTGVMSLFAFLIIIIKSRWINKLIYIAFGGLLLILMNAARVVYILVHLYNHGKYTLNLEAHDLSNYFFYSVVFILLIIYIYWFQDLTINFKQHSNGTQNQTPSHT